MYISYFRVIFLEFRSCSNHIVEQIPQLSLQEVPVDSFPVLDLHLKNVGVVIVLELN